MSSKGLNQYPWIWGLRLALIMSCGAADAAPVKVLYKFKGGDNGYGPNAGVIADGQGNLYGTTIQGGGGSCKKIGCGTVFKLAPSGAETVLYVFQGGTDGSNPEGVVGDKSGNLYGTTAYGGDEKCGRAGCGTVFKLAPDGSKTTLHVFEGSSDGAYPGAGLFLSKDGNLYGTTQTGGHPGCGGPGCGTVYRITPSGIETVLYTFCGLPQLDNQCPDGQNPLSTLTEDKVGNLYGTTLSGGSAGWGTVFELTKTGKETVLYSFCLQELCKDGQAPAAGLAVDKSGNLFGTTQSGGAYALGEVFEIAADGAEIVLHSFGNGDGGVPTTGVIVDNAGDLFGTVEATACNQERSLVYRLSPNGDEKISCLDAFGSSGVIDHNGFLYGTAVRGGRVNDTPGLVFTLRK